jgi:hypothetical protein
MFAWPETALLGSVPPAGLLQPVPLCDLEVTRVENVLGAPGRQIRFTCAAAAPRLLLLDAEGRAQGLALRPFAALHWTGWLGGDDAGATAPTAAALR